MNRHEDRGRAIGKQLLKTSGSPYHHAIRAMQHESNYCFSADGSLLEAATIREAARPSAQTGCSTHSIINTVPTTVSRLYAIRLSFSAIFLIATAMLFLSRHTFAAERSITPNLTLKETYSDNIRLAPAGSETSDWVTEINPGISLTDTGPNLKFYAAYQMQNIIYAKESNSNRTNHYLSAGANAKLVDNLLFLDGNANVNQQNIFLFGPQPSDNTNITGNRTTVFTYSISPYLRHDFDALASSELRYTHDEVRTLENALSNSKGDSALFNVTSGPAFSRFNWGLHYSKQIIDYSNYPTANTEISSGDLGFSITPKFSLIGTKGYEKYDQSIGQNSVGQNFEGPFWTGGFFWTPSARTHIKYSTGYRFFGKTYALDASLHSRNTVWNVNYSDDITTNRSQFLIPATINTASFLDQLFTASIPDPVLRKQFIDSFILNNGLPPSLAENVNYFSNGYFLQRRLQASVALNSTKSTFILSAFESSRESLTSLTADSILLGTSYLATKDNTEETGGNATWVWRLTSRTNINANTSYTISRHTTTHITQRNWLTSLGMTKHFRPKLDGSVELRRNQTHSDQIGGSYLEHAIIASVLMRF
jgi:uncharacterized protein (PEP-CTERM system associated)